MSDSLQSHVLQYTSLPCPSPTPGACSNWCPLSRWCHPTISSSVVPFSQQSWFQLVLHLAQCFSLCTHIWMWELDYKESWVLKNWCFWTMVLEKTLESSLDSKEIQQVHPKGNQSWVFIGRPDAEAETSILWPPDVKNWLTWKDPDAGNNWRWEEKGTTEDEMVGWHHRLNGHQFEQAPGVGDHQCLFCCLTR